MSRNISIKIENLNAIISGDPVIVCNNRDYVITFTFDMEWDAYDVKTARFVYTSGGHIRTQDIVFTGNVCPVPVFTGISDVLVGVFAGDIHTTTPAKIYCRKSILDYDGPPEEPDPDVYAQIMELINSGQLQGPAGDSGATYTPTVSYDGELSWTNDRGLDNPEPVNIRGPQGKDGSPGPQGPPGDNTAALEAARVAIDAAANANAAADAARELAPAVEQLKDDLSDKLPKSPANWEQWTESEQTVARERIGIPKWELIEKITLGEDVQIVYRNVYLDGKPYSLDDVLIDVEFKKTDSDYNTGPLFVYFKDESGFNAARLRNEGVNLNGIDFLLRAEMHCANKSFGVPFGYIGKQYVMSANLAVYGVRQVDSNVKGIEINGNLPAGTIITIRGVKEA